MAMDVMSHTEFQSNLAKKMKEVCNNHKSLIVTNNNRESVVVISLEDYKTLEETKHLLKNPEQAKKFLEAIRNQ